MTRIMSPAGEAESWIELYRIETGRDGLSAPPDPVAAGRNGGLRNR